jgi:hypothetical protein
MDRSRLAVGATVRAPCPYWNDAPGSVSIERAFDFSLGLCYRSRHGTGWVPTKRGARSLLSSVLGETGSLGPHEKEFFLCTHRPRTRRSHASIAAQRSRSRRASSSSTQTDSSASHVAALRVARAGRHRAVPSAAPAQRAACRAAATGAASVRCSARRARAAVARRPCRSDRTVRSPSTAAIASPSGARTRNRRTS